MGYRFYKKNLISLLLSYVFLFISGCITAEKPQTVESNVDASPPLEWQSPLLKTHPLVGQIFNTSTQSPVSRDQLFTALDQYRYLLIGEKHDNPDHHQIEQLILESIAQPEQTRIVFEMLNYQQNDALRLLSSDDSLSQIKTKLEWNDKSWSWLDYGPLIQVGLIQQSEIIAGNLPRETLLSIYQQGTAELSNSQRFSTFGKIPESVRERILTQVFDSHCQTMAKERLSPMVDIQIARDASMAFSLSDDLKATETAVLISGNFHNRKDLGVPLHLNILDPKKNHTLVIALLEVEQDRIEPGDYTSIAESADYIWFTPKFSDQDYCAELRARAEKKRTAHQ